MIDVSFFYGFATGTFVTLIVTTILFAARYTDTWNENIRLRDVNRGLSQHPSTTEVDLDIHGNWGTPLDGIHEGE